MDPELAALKPRLDLRPHPEGGWYRETYRDACAVRADDFDGPRSASTAIYFVLADRAALAAQFPAHAALITARTRR